MSSVSMPDLAGASLGEHSFTYDEFDAILYALAVGAHATDLDQVFERDLVVLPTYCLAWGLWAPDRLGLEGAFDPRRAVHSAQTLDLRKPLPRRGTIEMSADVVGVWDKGAAAVIDIQVRSEYFDAVYTIHAAGSGDFGGDAPPRWPNAETAGAERRIAARTHPDQAALYRLTGDRHFMHIDPAFAVQVGSERPILHGLCTLAVCIRAVAHECGTSPTSLTSLAVRFSGMVTPGDTLDIAMVTVADGAVEYTASVAGRSVLRSGRATFGDLDEG